MSDEAASARRRPRAVVEFGSERANVRTRGTGFTILATLDQACLKTRNNFEVPRTVACRWRHQMLRHRR